MAGLQPTAATARPLFERVLLMLGISVLALIAAWGFPRLDHTLNPGAGKPGLVSFLGVGLAILALTLLLLSAGLRDVLPKTEVFLAAALGYNALLIAVKFGLGPAGLYAVNASNNGFFFLYGENAYPGLAAIAAVLYGGAFFALYLIFHSGLQRRLGMPISFELRVIQLFIVMFVLAVVGTVTLVGVAGFFEYSISIFTTSLLGALIGFALLGAVILCSVAFKEARDQAVMLRNISMFSTFAWIGLAFIAAYHVLWLVFLLTLISLWPLRVFTSPTSGVK